MAAHPKPTALATCTVPFAAAALLLLRRFPPNRYAVYPACPFHALTGLQCPGCGATRALAAILHGHLAEAWRDNSLFTLLLPCAAVYLLLPLLRRRRPQPLPTPAVVALLSLALAFMVLRNLPR